jgi:hypothetical protein
MDGGGGRANRRRFERQMEHVGGLRVLIFCLAACSVATGARGGLVPASRGLADAQLEAFVYKFQLRVCESSTALACRCTTRYTSAWLRIPRTSSQSTASSAEPGPPRASPSTPQRRRRRRRRRRQWRRRCVRTAAAVRDAAAIPWAVLAPSAPPIATSSILLTSSTLTRRSGAPAQREEPADLLSQTHLCEGGTQGVSNAALASVHPPRNAIGTTHLPGARAGRPSCAAARFCEGCRRRLPAVDASLAIRNVGTESWFTMCAIARGENVENGGGR